MFIHNSHFISQFFFCIIRFFRLFFCQNERLLEVKQINETVEDTRRSEKTIKIETKLSAAEQKREKELQKKLEVIKKNVRIKQFARSIL